MTDQKIILITGCSSGIGYLTALRYARGGHKVYAGVRDLQSQGIKGLMAAKKKGKLPLELIQLDIRENESVKNAITQVLKKSKRIDILINNAGFGYLGPIENFSLDEIRDQYETNIFGVLRMVNEVSPIMRRQEEGLIINLSSIAGLIPFPLFSVYSSSKFALETLSEGMRFELAHFGIKVVIVEPGSFLTKFSDNRKHPQEFYSEANPYKKLVKNFFSRYQNTHDKAKVGFLSKIASPDKVAQLLYQISKEKHPKPRYMIGYDAYLFYTLKRLLPWQVWEWLLHRAYNW
ncbi:MAG: SDR family oxidoreductase [Patescibacteria group bacterium]